MNDRDPSSEHLSPDRVAAYVDRELSEDARRKVEMHLADCDECREEIAAVMSLIRRPRRPTWSYVMLPAAAAAAILLLVALPSRIDERDQPTLRSAISEGISAIAVVRPALGENVPADGIELAWRSFTLDAQYNVRLTTADGSEVWRTSTRDTSTTLPSGLSLVPGQTYFWYVDALLPDGSTATTGIRRFIVGP